MSGESIQYHLRDADLQLYPQLYSQSRADGILRKLLSEIIWRQDRIHLYGRHMKLPRLTAWYGDPGKIYTYSGISMEPLPWIRCLTEIRERLQVLTRVHFNSVLLNLYRDGNDSIGWHSDDEKSLGQNPVIGSVSFGATRRFKLRHKLDKTLKQSIDLHHGSLLMMAGATQHHWRHCVAKTRIACGPRINLTFRTIV